MSHKFYEDTYEFHNWEVKFKSGRWGGPRSKGEGRKCSFDQNRFLHSDLLKLCLKKKLDITKFFLDTIVFLDEKKSLCEVTR